MLLICQAHECEPLQSQEKPLTAVFLEKGATFTASSSASNAKGKIVDWSFFQTISGKNVQSGLLSGVREKACIYCWWCSGGLLARNAGKHDVSCCCCVCVQVMQMVS